MRLRFDMGQVYCCLRPSLPFRSEAVSAEYILSSACLKLSEDWDII